MNNYIIIACSIFYDEMKAILPEAVKNSIIWIPAGLHANLNELLNTLNEVFSRGTTEGKKIKILYGINCHPDLKQIAEKYGADILPFKDCITIFLGERIKDYDEKSMLMTPGWVRNWKDIMFHLGWDEVDVRINLGRYERVVIFQSDANPLTEEEILEFFDLIKIPIEIEKIDLTKFKENLLSLL